MPADDVRLRLTLLYYFTEEGFGGGKIAVADITTSFMDTRTSVEILVNALSQSGRKHLENLDFWDSNIFIIQD